MITFRKMTSQDRAHIYYFLASDTLGFFRIYTKNLASLEPIAQAETYEDAKEECRALFNTLKSMRYERVKDAYLPNITPLRYPYLELPHFVINPRKKRAVSGNATPAVEEKEEGEA